MISKKKVKNILLFLFALMIIIFSFIMPKLLFEVEDLSREKEIFARARKESKIDVQAEKIYLVMFLHDIYQFQNEKIYYNDGKTVTVSMPLTEKTGNKGPNEKIKNEIEKLVNSGIIKEFNFDEVVEYIETINRFGGEYNIITGSCVNKGREYLDFAIEEKTGKIISCSFSDALIKKDISRKEQLENYTKYLDLDIINDWKYEENTLKSEKAQLSVFWQEMDGPGEIIITPTETYKEYEDEKYEAVEKK